MPELVTSQQLAGNDMAHFELRKMLDEGRGIVYLGPRSQGRFQAMRSKLRTPAES